MPILDDAYDMIQSVIAQITTIDARSFTTTDLEIYNLKKQLERLRAETEFYKKETQKLRGHAHRSAVEIQATGERLYGAKCEIRRLQTCQEETEAAHQQVVQDSDSKTHELIALQKKHHAIEALLRIHSVELQDAQQYLSKVDNVPDADVLHAIQKVNAEVFHMAAQLAESLKFDNHCPVDFCNQLEEGTQLEGRLGLTLVQSRKCLGHQDDPICVQIALQGCMTMFSNWVIETWDFLNYTDKGPFGNVYASLNEKETQNVAGRWRVLTRSHIKSLLPKEPEVARRLQNLLIYNISEVLHTAGLRQRPQEMEEALERIHGEQMGSVIRLCLGLRTATGEHILSRDIETLVVEPGVSFDVEQMQDAFNGVDIEKGRTAVLCVTELGLRCVEKDGNGKMHRTTLLKPKVALETMVRELGELGFSDLKISGPV
ncbi:predicted protein [Sparassis crispa]|uniref:Uncharacterized protein n=1 Tax=Sparassis crispa TaxID=139825 RepID=A0A401GAV4_9APHY|nr:predicted protein [Sparassis crispa]GBE79273.1 predicted protein [Sparassis crispa]